MQDTNINQSISIEGDQTDFNIAGRDIIYQQYKPEFFSPSLDDYEDSRFVSPIDTPQLVEQTMRDHFLILGGHGYYKPALARHIAWKVLGRLTGDSIEVKEWANSTNPQNLELYLQKEENPTVFLLPNISPQNVDYNLREFYRTARKKEHYVIISTNNPLAQWRLGTDMQHLAWQPDSTQTLYDPRELTNLLLSKLDNARGGLPGELKNKDFKKEGTLLGNLQIGEVAAVLKTPENIDIFVRLLLAAGRQKPLDETIIKEIIENCSSDKRTLEHWFYHSLSPREQSIAIGLCLFEGIDDDQFFAAMETLVEHSWHKRDPSLQALDYCDLDALNSYFSFNPLSRDGFKRVESQLPGQRQKLLETVWDSHRRQIFNALPVLEDFLIDSVSHTAIMMNRELLGTIRRRRLLREVISEALCSIGLKPADSIRGSLLEDTLLRLAAQENQVVQIVAAQTMARWRYYDQHEKLFNTLQSWQGDKTWKILKVFLEDREIENRESPQVYIKATIALTVGFAALYDPPNKMHEKLCELLEQLAEDVCNRFIRVRFAYYTLPLVVRFHASQLRDILYNMLKYPVMAEPIGASLAAAIQGGVEEAKDILDSWFEQCAKERPGQFSREEVTHRESVMAAVAYTFGWLQYEENDEQDGLITPDVGFERLRTILRDEGSPFVRRAAVAAMIYQIGSNIEEIQRFLQTLFSNMHEHERAIIADKLVDIHLKQRASLERGDAYLPWDNKLYPVWLEEKYPLTAVEKVIKNWLKQITRKEVSQIAFEFEASDKLTDFEAEEEKFILEEKENREKNEQQNQENVLPTQPVFALPGDNNFVIRLISWLVGFPQRKYQEKIRWLLPIVIKKRESNPDKIEFMLKKLDKYLDEEIKIIAKKLKWAILLVNKKEILFFSLAGILVLLIVVLALFF